MATTPSRALIVFALLVLVGSVAAVALISRLRERRWQREGDDLEAFLSGLPEKNASQSFVGSPALVFERRDDSTYVEQPPEQAKVFIVTREVPETGILRRMLENRPYRIFRTSKESMVTRSEGMIVVGGKPFVVRSFETEEGRSTAELWSTGPGAQKIGSLELEATPEKVVRATIELDQTGQKYDLIIARDHPNFTKLAQSIRGAGPLTRAEALAMFRESYRNASASTGQAPR